MTQTPHTTPGTQPSPHLPPPGVLTPERQRSYGMLAHLAPAIALPLSAGTLGFVTYPLICLVATVVHVIGAVKASNGELWTPPGTYRFVQ